MTLSPRPMSLRRSGRAPGSPAGVVGVVVLAAVASMGGLASTDAGAASATSRVATRPKATIKPRATVPKPTVAPKATVRPTASGTSSAAAGCRREVRVMPLGDSLTSFPDSYRGPLFRSLSVGGPKVDFVGAGFWEPEGGGDPQHEGHGGYSIGPAPTLDFEGKPANLADNVAKWIPAARPDVIVLAIGTNDVAAGPSLAGAAPGKLTALVEQLRRLAPDAVIVTSDVPPTGSPARATPEITAINAAAKRAAATIPGTLYAPTFDRLVAAGYDPARHTADGTHFTAEGGRMYAAAFLPTVRDAVSQSAPCR